MSDWGDETKPRADHSGRFGMDRMLKEARRGDVAAVRRYLREDPSLARAKSGGHNRTFLWEATRGGRLELVKFLLDNGADPNVPGRIRAETPLLLKPYCIARRYRRKEIAELLLAAPTEIDVYTACYLGDESRVEELLKENPATANQEQSEDTVWRVTPLHFAVAGGRESLVRRLLDAGAAVAPYTRLLCDTAVRLKRRELIPLLVSRGAEPSLVKEWTEV